MADLKFPPCILITVLFSRPAHLLIASKQVCFENLTLCRTALSRRIGKNQDRRVCGISKSQIKDEQPDLNQPDNPIKKTIVFYHIPN
ncbi:hypothetical protein CHISP_1070 [Chitinispirillum alkaliphilum]|nr:hypothetical protein CHISP_1070 [Chitinispirillum alkaliphilum]